MFAPALNIRRSGKPAGSVIGELPPKPTELAMSEKQQNSVTAAEHIMRIAKKVEHPKRLSPVGSVLRVTQTVETVPIPLHPETVREGLSSDYATLIHHTVEVFRLGRIARLSAGRQDTEGQTPESSASHWLVQLGVSSGKPVGPEDVIEEIKDIAPPVILNADVAADLADPAITASMDSFAICVAQIGEALQTLGEAEPLTEIAA